MSPLAKTSGSTARGYKKEYNSTRFAPIVRSARPGGAMTGTYTTGSFRGWAGAHLYVCVEAQRSMARGGGCGGGGGHPAAAHHQPGGAVHHLLQLLLTGAVGLVLTAIRQSQPLAGSKCACPSAPRVQTECLGTPPLTISIQPPDVMVNVQAICMITRTMKEGPLASAVFNEAKATQRGAQRRDPRDTG